MDWQTILGTLLGAGGLGYAANLAWTWLKSKTPAAAGSLVDEVLERLQAAASGESSVPGRLEALEKAESLIRYFEAKSNVKGTEAMVAVVKEILVSSKA